MRGNEEHHTEESAENGYTREKEDRTTEDKMESQRDLKSTWLRAGKDMERAMWKRMISSYTDDPT